MIGEPKSDVSPHLNLCFFLRCFCSSPYLIVTLPWGGGGAQIKQDRVSLKNVLASSPRTIWVPRSNCRKVSAGSQETGAAVCDKKGRRFYSKLDVSRQEALSRALRGLSAGARIPIAGIAGLRAAMRRRVGTVVT